MTKTIHQLNQEFMWESFLFRVNNPPILSQEEIDMLLEEAHESN